MADESAPEAEARFQEVFAHLPEVIAYARRRGSRDPEAIGAEALTIAWRKLADIPRRRSAFVSIAAASACAVCSRKAPVSVGPSGAGRARVIWQCPGREWCGDLAGFAWAPDGEHLALSLGELGATTGNVGLHIVDLRTGTDRRMPAAPGPRHAATQGRTVEASRPLYRAIVRTFGCFTPNYLAWSPDGKLLAYTYLDLAATPDGSERIYTIRPDGSGRRLVPTHTIAAVSPTWSPDSKRLAFSTGEMPLADRNSNRSFRSAVYVVDLDGSHERRLAWGALPDWSPNGKRPPISPPAARKPRTARAGSGS